MFLLIPKLPTINKFVEISYAHILFLQQQLILDEAVLVIDGDELKFAKPLLGAIGKLTEVENIITTQKKRIIDERTPRTWWWVSDVKKIQLNKEEAELDKLSSFISTLKAEFWGYQSKQNAQFTWYEYRNFKDFEVPFLNAKEIFDSKPRWKIIIYNDTLNQNITSINLGVGATNYKISDPSVQYIKLSEIHKFVNKEFKDKAKAIKENPDLSKQQKKEQFKALRKERTDKMNTFLTPEQVSTLNEQKKSGKHGGS